MKHCAYCRFRDDSVEAVPRSEAEDLRIVDTVDQGRGPGMTVWACAPCREENGVLPLDGGEG